MEAGELTITKALVESRDHTIYEKDTKTHQARRLAVDPETMEVLRAWRAEVEERSRLGGVKVRADGFVLSGASRHDDANQDLSARRHRVSR